MNMPTPKGIRPCCFSVIGVLALAVHLVASFAYSNWTWGFNHYFFLPPSWRFAAFALGCILCLPWVWDGLCKVHSWVSRRFAIPRVGPRVADIAVAGVACIGFWLLRTRTHFLGDGRLLIGLLNRDIWFHPHEPLDRLIHYGVLMLTRPTLGWDAEKVYAVVSVIAGAGFVLGALRLGAMLGRKALVAAFLLTLGSVQVFFGYVESYSLATAMILIYMVLGLKCASSERRLIWVALALATGTALHHSLGFLVPSFVYLLWIRLRDDTSPVRNRVLMGIGTVALILAPIMATYNQWDRSAMAIMYVPWSLNPLVQYAFVSLEHLVDFVNEQILISPLGWMVAGAFGIAFWRHPALRRSRRFGFLFAVGASGLLLSLVLRPGLGGSRDWDLWSMASLPYIVAGTCWVAYRLGRVRRLRGAAWVLVVIGVFHTAPWVYVNHSERLSTDRFARMLEHNPLWTDKRLGAGHASLAYFLLEQRALDTAADHLERAVDLVPDRGRYWSQLGAVYHMMRRYREAESLLEHGIRLDPDDAKAHATIGMLHLDEGRLSEAEAAFRRASELDPKMALAHHSLGQIHLVQGKPVEAIEPLRRAAEVEPMNAVYWYWLAKTLEEAGRDQEGLDAWKRVLSLARNDPAFQGVENEAHTHIRHLETGSANDLE